VTDRSGAGEGSWASARNVLAVRLDSVGDVLMTTPALRALAGVEGTRVTLLTSPAGASIARLVPEIDDVIAYEAPWMKHAVRVDADADLAMVRRLRARAFDAAVVFTVFSQSPLPAAMLMHLARIPRRAAHCRENPYGLLTEWIRETEPEGGIRHEVRRQLDLVAALGRTTTDERLSLGVPTGARERARALLRDEGIEPGGRWVLVHPGSSAPSRRYPPELFARAAHLVAAAGFGVVFSGSRGEVELVEGIRRGMGAPSASLAGRLELDELAAVVEAAPVLLTNNTGPAHVAAAVGTPVVDLYALTNPQHAPWQVTSRVLFHDVPCRNCFSSVCREGHHRCLRGVEPRAVAEAVAELYARATGAPGRERSGAAGADPSGGALVPAGS
jgi:lipopolysaccharide heptosyltransferase II